MTDEQRPKIPMDGPSQEPPDHHDAVRGRPFVRGKSGNPTGRPLGARNRTTMAAQALLDGKAEAITEKVIEWALSGDTVAIRICMDRLVPPRREQPVEFELRKLESVDNAKHAIADVITAVAAGKLTVGEGAAVVSQIEAFVRACRSSQAWTQSETQALRDEEAREREEEVRKRWNFALP